jgi:hypothetical protein
MPETVVEKVVTETVETPEPLETEDDLWHGPLEALAKQNLEMVTELKAIRESLSSQQTELLAQSNRMVTELTAQLVTAQNQTMQSIQALLQPPVPVPVVTEVQPEPASVEAVQPVVITEQPNESRRKPRRI